MLINGGRRHADIIIIIIIIIYRFYIALFSALEQTHDIVATGWVGWGGGGGTSNSSAMACNDDDTEVTKLLLSFITGMLITG